MAKYLSMGQLPDAIGSRPKSTIQQVLLAAVFMYDPWRESGLVSRFALRSMVGTLIVLRTEMCVPAEGFAA